MYKKSLAVAFAAVLSLHAGIADQAVKHAQALQKENAAGLKGMKLDNELIGALTQKLGVSPKQAAGGTAALLQEAAAKIPQGDYSQILKSVPGLSQIADQGKMLSQLSSLAGKGSVTDTFKALGMQGDTVKQFAPVVMDYAKKFISPAQAELLQKAWSAFF